MGAPAGPLQRAPCESRRPSGSRSLDRFEAETLEVKPGSPAIVLTRTVFRRRERVVELARDVYRGDRTEFYVTAPVESIPTALGERAPATRGTDPADGA